MFKWCKLSCKTVGIILAGVGGAVIVLTLLPLWAIISILGIILIVFGLSMIF